MLNNKNIKNNKRILSELPEIKIILLAKNLDANINQPLVKLINEISNNYNTIKIETSLIQINNLYKILENNQEIRHYANLITENSEIPDYKIIGVSKIQIKLFNRYILFTRFNNEVIENTIDIPQILDKGPKIITTSKFPSMIKTKKTIDETTKIKTIKCPHCGSSISKRSKICSFCFKKIYEKSRHSSKELKKEKKTDDKPKTFKIPKKQNISKKTKNLIKNKTKTHTTQFNKEYIIDLKNYNIDFLYDILIEHKDLFKEINDFRKENFTNKDELIKLILSKLTLEELQKEFVNPLVIKNFPKPKPRLYQIETISRIYNAIEKGYKYIILEAPPGFGKSTIATTLANIYKDEKSYILTPNNQLRNHFRNEFKKNFMNLNPRSAMECKKGPNDCGLSYCQGEKCEFNKGKNFEENIKWTECCKYIFQIRRAKTVPNVLLTYHYFFNETFYSTDYLDKRKLLICDESHNIDDLITSGLSLKIFETTLENVGLNIEELVEILNEYEDYYYEILKIKDRLKAKLKDNNIEPIYIKRIKLSLNQINNFLSLFEEDYTNLSFKYETKSSKYKKLLFRPIKIRNIVKDKLFKYGEVCIFMSSSIFNSSNFAKELGINEDEIYKAKVPPYFRLEDNPITIYNDVNMSNKYFERNVDKSVEIVRQIMEKHKKEKGIIHTFNYNYAEELIKKLNSDRIIYHNNKNRENQLKAFKRSKDSLVLVSPSMHEGVDLPGKQCRFQIIYKLPYLPNADDYVNKRKNIYEDSKEWYHYKMLTKLIQTHGRGIRFEGDYCKTYVIDNRLNDIVNDDLEDYNIIPKYFINSIISN